MIELPPSPVGATHATSTEPSPNEPVTLETAPGTPAGVTAPEAPEAEPVPAALVAVTVNVYAVPLVRPVTAHDVVAVVQVEPPDEAVTVYEVMGAPPVENGADQETNTEESAEAPETPVGIPGTVAGVTAPEEADDDPVPTPVVAVTVNV